MGSPRFLVILSVWCESKIKALIFISAPHLGQISGLNSKTIFIHRAQVWEVGRVCTGCSSG